MLGQLSKPAAPPPEDVQVIVAITPTGSQRQQMFLFPTAQAADAAVTSALMTGHFKFQSADSVTVIQVGAGTQYVIASKAAYDKAVETSKNASPAAVSPAPG